MEYVIGIIFLIFVLVTFAKTVTVVRQSKEYVIERFGRYSRTLKSGLNIVVPYIERVSFKADLREQVHTFEAQPMITKDNATVNINAVTYYRVIDAYKAFYSVAEFQEAISQLIITTLRNLVGELELDQTFTSRNLVNDKLQSVLDEATTHWGIKITRVEVKEITPSRDIQEAMSKQMVAERTKRASILEAEGKKRAAILEAEGMKESAVLSAGGRKEAIVLDAQGIAEAAILKAEGEKKAMELIMNAFGENSKEMLLLLKYLETLPKIAQGKGATIVVPDQFSGVSNLSAIAGKILGQPVEHSRYTSNE